MAPSFRFFYVICIFREYSAIVIEDHLVDLENQKNWIVSLEIVGPIRIIQWMEHISDHPLGRSSDQLQYRHGLKSHFLSTRNCNTSSYFHLITFWRIKIIDI